MSPADRVSLAGSVTTGPVRIGEVTLPQPVMTASGCAGTGTEIGRFLDLRDLGAFVTRTITLDPVAGSAGPRAVETPAGLLTDVGLQNVGLTAFLATELPALAQGQVRTVVSVAGSTLGEYAELARRVGESPGVVALEVNLASADRDARGRMFGDDPYAAGKVLAVVRRDAPRGVAVLAKLAPGRQAVDVARAAAKNGADGVVVGHGLPGLAIDARTLRPSVHGVVGGPAVLPVAMQAVWQVHEALPDVPVIGVGGIRTGTDALAMLAAGATAVQVGTATLRDPHAPLRVLAELTTLLADRQLTSTEAVGIAHRGGV